MNMMLAGLSAPELRNLLLEESKKFNAAIKFGSPVSDLEEIQTEIKKIEKLLKNKETREIPNITVESFPPHLTNRRHKP